MVGLNLADYDRKTKELRVRGKGGKERLVYAEGGAALEAWVKKRTLRDRSGPLFYSINKGGRILRRRMSAQAVLYILKKRAAQIAAPVASPRTT